MTDFDSTRFQRFELEGWSRKASGYHSFYRPLTAQTIPSILAAVSAAQGSRLLDVGSGPGYVLAEARAAGARPIGIDQAEPMARLCRDLLGDVEYLLADAQRLPIQSGTIDSVVGNFVLHHLPEQPRALDEFARVLRPGGRLALTVWQRPEHCRFIGVFVDAVTASGASVPESVPTGPPMVTGEAEYHGILERQGFSADPVRSLEWSHDFESPDLMWNGLLASSVRVAATITDQDPAIQSSIRTEFSRIVEDYRTPSGLEVPVAALLITGTRS